MPKPNTNRYEDLGDGSTKLVLASGAAFVIDTEDVSMLRGFGWCRDVTGYAKASYREDGRTKHVYLHRMLCRVSVERPRVDHIDGDQSNNRRSNLRACTQSENLFNQKISVRNRSGAKGVYVRPNGRFAAQGAMHGKHYHLGLFSTLEEAAAAAARFRDDNHGEFARHA
ncbi:HNH endonuclease [Reyranella sp.]|jgi:hypothetical protein|uniref:HNH endonuclease n=1 Tax=Reyranella sp. TaxID=1929291 RepID=UPI000BD14EE7|nr:HNH endonuclease [Reyranella sp.]OYY35555.1 MAG: hypothetical protein B7Y57_25585 [Rhodospirillales bacterium 35-66-84]OYZ91425.1 MAG: hypothetical protein B7Y08_25455 [Rhodospirillales bacterium 24-66-33]OZB26255.1 MAG: hypothetical protein B7X63_09965 [Rhodospirillales bacterium 39-66-50]HQS15025.1 HNH endonuclease [Reyranella sp.]HQT10834.1 HNH endonuclease [Reyranella sp.]